jgi:hypothetical protein
MFWLHLHTRMEFFVRHCRYPKWQSPKLTTSRYWSGQIVDEHNYTPFWFLSYVFFTSRSNIYIHRHFLLRHPSCILSGVEMPFLGYGIVLSDRACLVISRQCFVSSFFSNFLIEMKQRYISWETRTKLNFFGEQHFGSRVPMLCLFKIYLIVPQNVKIL